MAFSQDELMIVSDEEYGEDPDEATIFVRHVQPISPDQAISPFNVQAVPIVGNTGVIPRSPGAKRRKSSSRSDGQKMDRSQSLDDEEDSSEAITLFIQDKGSKTPVVLSDFENDESTKRSRSQARKKGVPYRTTDYQFGDSETTKEIQQNELLSMRKRNVLLNVFLLGVISLFQGVGFLFFFPDILLLNIDSVKPQHAVTFGLLVTCVISSLASLVVINITGQRWGIFIGVVGTSLFICARIFESSAFVTTASLVAGLAQGLYTIAVFVYLHDLGVEYSSLSGQNLEVIISYFSAYIHAWGSAAPFLSALLRYTFLSSESSKSFHDIYPDKPCGASFCWESRMGISLFELEDVHRRDATDLFRLEGLLGAFLVCSLGSAFLAWSNTTEEMELNQLYKNRSLASYSKQESEPEVCSDLDATYTLHLLLKPLRCFFNRHTAFLIPLFIFLGYQQMLMYSLFVQTYTECSSDLSSSLLVAAILSATSAVVSLPMGALIATVGKIKVILPALGVYLIILVVMVTNGDLIVKSHYAIAAFWGMTDAVLQNIVIVLCTVVMPNNWDGAVVCTRVCQLIGYMMVYLLQLHACNMTILIFSVCLLLLAAALYVTMEIQIRLDKRAARTTSNRYVPLQTEASWLPRMDPVQTRSDHVESLTSRLTNTNVDLYGT